MYNPYMNPYGMPPPLHPKKSGTKIAVFAILAVVVAAVMVMVFGHKGPLIEQNTTSNNAVKSDSHDSHCLGSNTLLATPKGSVRLGDIAVGDKIMTYDWHTHSCRMSTVYGMRIHDRINHYQISTSTDTFSLSPSHLAILDTNEYIQARYLRVGDKLLSVGNSSKITNIEIVSDIAMNPIVLDGTIVMPNTTIISCWSYDKANVDRMTILMEVIRGYKDEYSPIELATLINRFYEMFLDANRDTTKIPEILNSLNIPIICK